jgi:STE24 endopeptidase
MIFGGGFIFLLTTLFVNVGSMFFFYSWISIIVIILVIQILYVPVLIPIFNKLTPLEDGELKTKIHNFATSVGYEVSKISTMDASKRSTKLNAFFSGFGKFKQIVLFDTLLDKMSDDEIVAVLAHEIGHNKHKHIWYLLIQQAITLSIYIGVLILVLNNDVFSIAFGFDAANFGFSIILFSVLLNPISILINLITSTLSRKYEFQADHYAAFHFNKESIEGALKVLSRANFSNLTPHPLYVKILYSHPPTVERIRAIRKCEAND